MNGKLKAVLLVILLFIPTYIAVAEYVTTSSGTVNSTRGIEEMVIHNPEGVEFSFSADNAQREEIEFLVALNKNAREQTALPEAMTDVNTFTVTYRSFAKESIYEYYLTRDPNAAYFKIPDGGIYKIDSEDAAQFLCKGYASCMYMGSTYPCLTVSGEDVVANSLEWRYKLFNGSYQTTDTPTTDSILTYRMNARMSLSFNLEPDVISIQVFDGDEMIYDGNYANLSSSVSVSETKLLRFHIEAKWFEIEGKEGQGEGEYNFFARVNAPASFYMNLNSVDVGEFCVITVKDKPDDADILFLSEPSINYEPVFVEDGDYYRALVPIALDREAGDYTFTVSCDGVTQEFVLCVNPKTFADTYYTVSEDILNATKTEATVASAKEIMTPIAKKLNVAGHLFEGLFIEGVPNGSQLITGFGRYRIINGDTSTRYQHIGVDYLMAQGLDITAVNNGVVVYVGSTDYTGNFVVVEHGLGLKTWYCHLSNVTVSVGDSVSTGDRVGISGATGFVSQGSTHITTTVFDVPVCPYRLWESGIALDNP